MLNSEKFKILEMNKDKYIENNQMSYSYVKELNGIDKIKQSAYFLGKAKKIAIITGAGTSTDSGIPDFRSNTGIYSEIPEEIFDINYFKRNPQTLQKLLINLFNNKDYKPNEIHNILTELQEEKDITIITQNIDSLNEKSGSKKVLHIHGLLNTGHCEQCKEKVNLQWEKGLVNLYDLTCDCGGYIRPDIVFYGEEVKHLSEAINAVKMADLILILGTSLKVYPVAELPSYANAETPIIIINRDKIELGKEERMSVNFQNDIANTLKAILNELN